VLSAAFGGLSLQLGVSRKRDIPSIPPGPSRQRVRNRTRRKPTANGREAAGMSVGIPKRQANRPQEPKDDLDRLMDSLDALDI
jgi:hypothetical protein